MSRLEKDLTDKSSVLRNVEKTIKDNDNVEKKLSRYMEDLKRNIERNKKKREEVMTVVRKYKREYDMKKDQIKSISQNIKNMEEGKDVDIDEGVGLKD
jgi:chromosome segregation ATPase